MDIANVYDYLNTVMGVGTLISSVLILLLWVRPVRNTLKNYSPLLRCVAGGLGLALIAFPLIYEFGFGFAPCLMCWMQRIAIWPAIVIMLVSFYRKETRIIAPYIYTLLAFGIVFALYHISLQLGVTTSSVCEASGGAACSNIDIVSLGFITMPVMSIVGQLLITTLVSIITEQEHI